MNRRLCTDARLVARSSTLALALLVAACREAPEPAPTMPILDASSLEASDASPHAADADGGVASALEAGPADAGLIVARPLDLTARALAEGFELALDRTKKNESLPPEARFELELPRLADVRVRLFDENDRAVPSQDRLEIGLRTRYTLVPSEPLVTGSRYTLVVDGQLAELASDEDGNRYEIVRVALRTAGEKPPKAPPKKKRSRKRRR